MQKEDRTTRKKRKSTSSRAAFCFNEVSNWPYLDDKETVLLELAREIRVFFYEWVERCETGKAWDLLCINKMFFESTLCCLTPLFGFFCFFF